MRVTVCIICGRNISVRDGDGWRNWVCGKCACGEGYDLRVPVSEWRLSCPWAWALYQDAYAMRNNETARYVGGYMEVPLEEAARVLDGGGITVMDILLDLGIDDELRRVL